MGKSVQRAMVTRVVFLCVTGLGLGITTEGKEVYHTALVMDLQIFSMEKIGLYQLLSEKREKYCYKAIFSNTIESNVTMFYG